MEQIVRFLQQLNANNNREWFTSHKQEYKECKAEFDRFVEKIIDGIRSFDDTIGPMTPTDCTYRIYRDTRFSQDKTPYKAHLGAYIAPGGKKSGYSGYYFQIGAQDRGFNAGCMLAVGNYYCEPDVLRTIREDIETDPEFVNTLDSAHGFYLDQEQKLKRMPKGFDENSPLAEYLKLKNFCLVKDVTLNYFTESHLEARLLADFASAKPFLDFINRAIGFVKGE